MVSLIQLESGHIATGDYDFYIKIWDIDKGECILTFKENGNVFCLLEFEPNQLLTGTSENTIGLWNLNSINNPNKADFYFEKKHFLWVNCLVKYNEQFFISASNDSQIIVWNYNKKKFEFILGRHSDCILTLIKLRDGKLCSGGADNIIKVWDFNKRLCLYELKQNSWIKCLCHFDDNTILFGCEDRTISIWKNYKEIELINGHSHSVRTLCKIDDNYFASGSFDKKIKFWDINTKNNIYTLEGHTGNVICIIKLKDNKLVSCSSDKTIIIWD